MRRAQIIRIGPAHRSVFRRIRGECCDRFCRVGRGYRGVNHRDDIDRLRSEIFIVRAITNWYRALRQRIGIRKDRIGQQQITVDS